MAKRMEVTKEFPDALIGRVKGKTRERKEKVEEARLDRRLGVIYP